MAPRAGKGEGAVMEWRPIETGPTNQQVLALFRGDRYVVAIKRADNDSPAGWCHHLAIGSFDTPNRGLTHWMPLPPPPKSEG